VKTRQQGTALFFLAASAAAFGDTLVVPNAQAIASGNSPITISGNSARIQEIVGSGQFASFKDPITITGLAVRSAPGTGPVNQAGTSLQITLSTTLAFPNTNGSHKLPSVTYANNLGPDATVVYNGAFTGSSPGCQAPGPCPFDMVIHFATPFTYDYANGRLLIDLVISAKAGTVSGSLDGVMFPDSSSSTVAVVSGDPTQATGALSLSGIVFGLQTSTSARSPLGTYGVLVNQWPNPGEAASALLAVANFDGAGNIIGSYTVVTSSYQVLSGKLTGNYFGSPDGTNTANITLDVGATIAASITVTDGGAGLQIQVTSGIGPFDVATGTGRIQSTQGNTPAGSYGLLLNRWSDVNAPPQGITGVFSFDGAGNVTGSYTLTGQDVGPGPLNGILTGTYSFKLDGTGSVTINLDIGVTSTMAFVVVDGGSGFLILQTAGDNGLNHVTSGTARLQ
jgi:hypothetical protein